MSLNEFGFEEEKLHEETWRPSWWKKPLLWWQKRKALREIDQHIEASIELPEPDEGEIEAIDPRDFLK